MIASTILLAKMLKDSFISIIYYNFNISNLLKIDKQNIFHIMYSNNKKKIISSFVFQNVLFFFKSKVVWSWQNYYENSYNLIVLSKKLLN